MAAFAGLFPAVVVIVCGYGWAAGASAAAAALALLLLPEKTAGIWFLCFFGHYPIWKALIEPVKVLANAGNQTTNINSINAHMWLPSAREVGIYSGTPYNEEISDDANEKTFSIFTDNASRIKKTYNGTGASGQSWWTRSAYAANSTDFAYVFGNGGSGNSNASANPSVCAGFSA